MWAVTYNYNFIFQEINSDTTLESSQTCDQVFENGILKSTTCSETHRATVLNNGDSGAVARATSSLTLVNTQDGISTAQSSTATHSCTIHFQHATGTTQKADKAALTSQDLVNKLCTQIENGVLSEETAGTFLRLRTELKSVAEADLQKMYENLLKGEPCKKDPVLNLFTNAVAMAGSSDSISFLAKLIKSKANVCEKTQRLFRLYTAFADKPTDKAMQSLKSLIENADIDPKFFLTASGLARQSCRTTGKSDCGKNPAYVAIAEQLAAHAQSNCQTTNEDGVQKSIFALQALGNLESLPSKAVPAISTCINVNNRRVKVHALQAFRRDPCQQSLKDVAKKILQNKDQPSDLRIQAYIAMSKCYRTSDSTFLEAVLKAEVSLQGKIYFLGSPVNKC